MVWILGISAFYHDSAAALLYDGKIIAAAQEERFSRKKNDSAFPVRAIQYVLQEGGISIQDVELIAFYDKPFLKFERLLETYHAFAPKGLKSFLKSIPVWVKEKIFLKKLIRDELLRLGPFKAQILFPEHHLSHAASAFYPSPFEQAAILTIDGVGEWTTTTIGVGEGNGITTLRGLHFPHSLGLLYSAFTYYCGFKVNSAEYKLMGLAPYGNAQSKKTKKFIALIKHHLVDIKEDGSLLLNMKYFQFATGFRMTYDRKWTELFGFGPRKPEDQITADHMNMALAIQIVTEEIVIKLAKTAKNITNSDNLVMAGGVALNSVANGKLIASGLFKKIWIQPAAGDAGGALGAALAALHVYKGEARHPDINDSMHGAYLGPNFDNEFISKFIRRLGISARYYRDEKMLFKDTAKYIADGKVVGWFQGRMEYGPRALGNRSILADARNNDMQSKLNLKIKHRESFRPFAPAVLEEDVDAYFQISESSPYMLMVVPLHQSICCRNQPDINEESLEDRLQFKRSALPAVTHVDYSARIQTVSKKSNPKFWNLIRAFKELTGTGALINTSFNVRGEPIVCTPEDAYRCFLATEMDILVMGQHILTKN